jgi:hypothetical protein
MNPLGQLEIEISRASFLFSRLFHNLLGCISLHSKTETICEDCLNIYLSTCAFLNVYRKEMCTEHETTFTHFEQTIWTEKHGCESLNQSDKSLFPKSWTTSKSPSHMTLLFTPPFVILPIITIGLGKILKEFVY